MLDRAQLECCIVPCCVESVAYLLCRECCIECTLLCRECCIECCIVPPQSIPQYLPCPNSSCYQTGFLEGMTTGGVLNGRGREGGGQAQDSYLEAQSPRKINNSGGGKSARDKSVRATSFPGPVYKPTRSMSPPVQLTPVTPHSPQSPAKEASTSGGHSVSKLGLVYNATHSANPPRSPPWATLTV